MRGRRENNPRGLCAFCELCGCFSRQERSMNRKVSVVGGAGNVGATVARGIAEKQLADVVVIDIADQKAAGVALDMLQTCPIIGSDSRLLGTGDYADSAGSD